MNISSLERLEIEFRSVPVLIRTLDSFRVSCIDRRIDHGPRAPRDDDQLDQEI